MLDADETTHNMLKLRVYPPKPMVLFPALPANVTIYLTVSEVCGRNPLFPVPITCHMYIGRRLAASIFSGSEFRSCKAIGFSRH
jgi:hypothetical protein